MKKSQDKALKSNSNAKHAATVHNKVVNITDIATVQYRINFEIKNSYKNVSLRCDLVLGILYKMKDVCVA